MEENKGESVKLVIQYFVVAKYGCNHAITNHPFTKFSVFSWLHGENCFAKFLWSKQCELLFLFFFAWLHLRLLRPPRPLTKRLRRITPLRRNNNKPPRPRLLRIPRPSSTPRRATSLASSSRSKRLRR